MNNKIISQTARLALGCSLLAISAGAVAQDDDSFALEEIIVTAQKRAQSLQDVPMSVTSLQGRKIADFAAGGEDIRLLSSRIPGLNAESSNGRVAPRFYIRGLGNTDFALAASQPVSIIMDDVVKENVILKSFPLFDIDRVEVLRGPQGTLFGRNTPAGIVKFDTRKPTQEAEGYFNASYGALGTFTSEAAMGGPLSDTVSYRVSGLYQQRRDWIDNDFSGLDNVMGGFKERAGRVQLLFTPNDNFSALASVHARNLDGTSAIFRANILTTGESGLNDNFDRDTISYGDTHSNDQTYKNWGASLKMEYDLSNGMTITSITAYEDAYGTGIGDIDGGNPDGPGFIPFQSTTRGSLRNLHQFTEELRLSGQVSDELFVQGGVYYFDSEFTAATNPFFIRESREFYENETWAVFAQAAYDVSDDTSVTVGMRYTDDKKSLNAFSAGFGVALDEVNLSGDHLSWDISVNHNIDDDVSVYGRIASGFRAPSIQGRDVAFFGLPSTAPKETIISYEAGVKADLVDNRLRWNAAVFYYDVSDLQVTAVGGATNSTRLESLAEVIGWGLETDIELRASEYVTVSIGASYANTTIHDTATRIPVCGSGACTVLNPNDGATAIIDGNPLPQAPDLTGNLVIDFNYPVGNDDEIFFTTDWSIQGETNLFLYKTTEFNTNGTFEGGVKFGYRWNDGQYEIAAYGRNITNEVNLKGGIDFNNNTGYVNAPRVYGFSVAANF